MLKSILNLDGVKQLEKEALKLINGKGAYALCFDGICAPNGNRSGVCIDGICYTEDNGGGGSGSGGSGGCNEGLLPDGTIGCI